MEIPKDTSHGDYASSFAMAGAKALHMAPPDAQTIVDHLDLEGATSRRWRSPAPAFELHPGPQVVRRRCCPPWRPRGPLLAPGGGPGRRGHGGVRLRQPHRPHAHGQRPGRRAGGHLANVLARDGWDTWKEFYVNDAGQPDPQVCRVHQRPVYAAPSGGGEFPLPRGGLPRG